MFSRDVLRIGAAATAAAIVGAIRDPVRGFHRCGFVGGVSGGADSRLVASLCGRALTVGRFAAGDARAQLLAKPAIGVR